MKRLPVNLATHPVEQRQWLRKVTAATALMAATLTLAHALLAWSLSDEPQSISPDVEAIAMLREWSDEVAELVTTADPRSARDAAIAVGLSNAFIDQRAFSWSSLFSTLEESMPDDVRLEIIQPVATVDGVRITLTAASRSGEALLAFLSALEERPDFLAVYPGRQLVGNDGDLRLSVEALARIDRIVGEESSGGEMSGGEDMPGGGERRQ